MAKEEYYFIALAVYDTFVGMALQEEDKVETPTLSKFPPITNAGAP